MIYSLFLSFLQNDYGPGVDSASNRNEYQEFSLPRSEKMWIYISTPPYAFMM
jgi:hypothetical protein